MPQKNTRELLEIWLDRPEISAWRAIFNAHRRIFLILEQELHQDGCSLPRFQLMFHLYFTGPLSPSKIADLMMVTRGNITSFIKRMIEDDLITTHQKSGQKRVAYGLTDLGIKHFEKIFPRHAKRVCTLVPKMPVNFVKQLSQIEKRISTVQKSKKGSSIMS